jgi:hypothetical protein
MKNGCSMAVHEVAAYLGVKRIGGWCEPCRVRSEVLNLLAVIDGLLTVSGY